MIDAIRARLASLPDTRGRPGRLGWHEMRTTEECGWNYKIDPDFWANTLPAPPSECILWMRAQGLEADQRA